MFSAVFSTWWWAKEFAEKEGCQSILYSAFKEILGETNVPIYWKNEREKTRKRRIVEIVENASKQMKPKPFRWKSTKPAIVQ